MINIFYIIPLFLILFVLLLLYRYKANYRNKIINLLCRDNYDLRYGRKKEVDKRLKKYFDKIKEPKNKLNPGGYYGKKEKKKTI